MRIAICIPIYKEIPDVYELISIDRLVKVTQYKYDIYFVRPNTEFNMQAYYDAMPGWEHHVFELPFDVSYFANITTYSELCKSYEFYSAFAEYDYLLIYQTDCYIVRDEIDDWASKGYDYIGAPIVGTGSGWKHVPYVGNGGFSLRKVSKFLELTNPEGEFLTEFANEIKEANDANENGYVEFEDLYFAELVPFLYSDFTKPNYNLAGQFAWDRNVDALYNVYLGKLPMGLHAFHKAWKFYRDKIDVYDKSGMDNWYAEFIASIKK